MIDEEKTYREKGYYSTDLRSKSHKPVWAVCDNPICDIDGGRGRWVQKCKYRDLCPKCAIKNVHMLSYENRTEKLKCIDDDITYADKGYRSIELKPSSNMLVWRVCDCCKTGRWIQFCQYSDLCQPCSVKTKEFINKQSEIKKGKRATDKTKKLLSESHKGEKSYSWKGGITHENKIFRHSFEYRQWRTSVFERDNYTCQECGLRGVVLNAHHILPLCDYRDPDYSLNIDNGITLCEGCHNKTKRKEYDFVDRYQKIIISNLCKK